MFPNGKPEVLLSAPVFLEIRPDELAKRIHHKPIAASPPDPIDPKMNVVCPLVVYLV